MNKRGQMQLSFGMIFSIILIIAFIAFAFYAIKIFLNAQEAAKITRFRENMQEDVDKVWKSAFSSQEETYSLPGKIKKVCFKKWNYENLLFEPADAVDLEPLNIDNINIEETTKNENPFCIENNNGISLILSKDYGETLVTIKRA